VDSLYNPDRGWSSSPQADGQSEGRWGAAPSGLAAAGRGAISVAPRRLQLVENCGRGGGAAHDLEWFTILGRLAESTMDAQRRERLQRTAPRQVVPEGTSSGKLRHGAPVQGRCCSPGRLDPMDSLGQTPLESTWEVRWKIAGMTGVGGRGSRSSPRCCPP